MDLRPIFRFDGRPFMSSLVIAMNDQFQDSRTYRKTAQPTQGATTYDRSSKPSGPRPDAAARRMMEIENETESFEIPTASVSMANRMRELRGEKGWTQKDLAARASLKVDVIKDIENGKMLPDARTIGRLEQVLGGPLRDKPAPKKK